MSSSVSSRRAKIHIAARPTRYPTSVPPSRRGDEGERGFAEGDRAGHRRGDREAVEDEGGGVVEQALAFQHGDDALGQAEVLQDGGRRDRVRRGDDGAERDRGGPGQVGHQQLGGHGHHGRREQDRAEGEQQDRAEVGAEGGPVRPVGARLEERRQEEDQSQLRIEFDRRQARHQGQRHSAQDQRDGERHVQATGDERQRHAGGQEAEQDFEDCHGACCPECANRQGNAGSRPRVREEGEAAAFLPGFGLDAEPWACSFDGCAAPSEFAPMPDDRPAPTGLLDRLQALLGPSGLLLRAGRPGAASDRLARAVPRQRPLPAAPGEHRRTRRRGAPLRRRRRRPGAAGRQHLHGRRRDAGRERHARSRSRSRA